MLPLLNQNDVSVSAFEMIRDQLGAVLAFEIKRQDAALSDGACKQVWIGRTTPFEAYELNAVNVQLAGGEYSNKSLNGDVDGEYQFYIDVHVKGGADDYKVQQARDRILAVCRYVVEHPYYSNLGFDDPLVSSSRVATLQLPESLPQAMDNMSVGRLIYVVNTSESAMLPAAPIVNEVRSKVFLHHSSRGYYYEHVIPS